MVDPWDAFAEIEFRLRTPGGADGSRRGDGWFAALSGQDHGELNVCGLAPHATSESARALAEAVGELPAVVFTSEHVDDEARGLLVARGFAAATVAEPLMLCRERPTVASGTFRIEPAGASHLDEAISLIAEAHRIDRTMLGATLGAAAAAGAAEPWLAWDDDGPVSTVWLVVASDLIGVTEMMTPPRHQRRGAGRQLLSCALAERWASDTAGALLLSTSAGRRLYASIGFVAVDEVVTCFRGIDDEVLDAIGQPRA